MYKIVNNSEPTLKDVTYSGQCPLTGEEATVTSYYRGSLWCKTDLQKTYCFSGIKCSLGKATPFCAENCQLVREKYL